MNKLLKGAIAGAAGVALLLGGAGTFALWNDAAVVSGGTIATGTLAIAKSGTATWTDISPGVANGTTFDPATQKIVPGDKVKLTQKVVLSTTGKNLKASFGFDPASVTTDSALASVLNYNLTATPVVTAGSAAVTANGANTYTITPGSDATTTVDVTFTVEFLDTTGTTGQSVASAADLSKLAFTLAQIRP
ncbi:alternate-type signal peptide domain-containing protein [Lacisediminihabitans profunda]|nr:alternate-type signal peptide domain-containing protein [Lacisediminihabitans profunda]